MAKTTSTHTRDIGETEGEERRNKSAGRRMIKSDDPEAIGGEREHGSGRRFITRPEYRATGTPTEALKRHTSTAVTETMSTVHEKAVRPAKYSPRTKNIEQRL